MPRTGIVQSQVMPSESKRIGYNPLTPADWNNVPDTGQKALDELSSIQDNVAKFFQGTFLEDIDALVIEDGGAVKMTLEQSGGGDLTMMFSDGYTVLDCTPIINILLTEGADANNPQRNYVYILKSAKILAVSTTGWPAAEHIKVGFFFIQTDVEVAARGALVNQNWNDHAASTSGAGIGQGHLTHMTERSRRQGAIWISGCEGVATQDGNDLWVSIAAGVVSQAHPHVFPALDSDTAGAGDTIDVVNDPDGAYSSINSLNEITKLSDGTAIGNNKYVKFNLWAVSNKSGTYSPMMLDLPSGQYNTASDAEIDVEGYADFSIPVEFALESTTGFLVASFVCKHTATAMEIQTTIDQRGRTPATAGGAGTGGGDVTAATVIIDHVITRGDGGAKGIQGSSTSIADNGVVSVPAIGDGGLTNYDLKVGNTSDYGMIQFGNAVMGRTSYKVGAIDLDGAILVRNIGGPVTSEIEFIWTESTGNTCRFALPKSAVGNATYNSRSMLLAGPAPADTDFVKVSYWQGQGFFHNLACDTVATGADLGVQNDLEVEGNIYADTIRESTPGADIALVNDVIVGGTVDGRDVAADGTVLDTAILDGDFASPGLMVRAGAGSYSNRSIAVADTKLTVANADGVGGNPTLGFGSVALADLSDGGTVVTAAVVIADNALVRGDGGARGTQGSSVLVTDAGAMSGLTQVIVGQLQLSGATITHTGASGSILLTPTGASGSIDVSFEGSPTQNRDVFRIVDTNYNASNADTRSSIVFKHSYDASNTDESAKITGATEQSWTTTASTRDGYLAFQTALNGTVSEKVRINSAGAVGINTTDPGGIHSDVRLDIRQNDRCAFAQYTYSNTATTDSRWFASRARGTEGSELAVQDNDVLALVQALGWSPSGSFRTAAYIKFDVDGTPATTTVPGAIGFWTTTTSSPTLRMTIQSDGDVLLDSGSSFLVRDAALGFNSSVDGQFDVFADTEVEITTPLIDLNAASIFASTMTSGTDQTDAGAAAGELYVDTNDDNTVKRGV